MKFPILAKLCAKISVQRFARCCRDTYSPMLSSGTLEPSCSFLEVFVCNNYKYWLVIIFFLLVPVCSNLLHFMWQSHHIRELKHFWITTEFEWK